MIRLILLNVFTIYFSVAAWKDWYPSLCALIFLTAFFQHPDMPKEMLGVQGMNHWNILLLNVCLSWIIHRGAEGSRWDLPRSLNYLLLAYLAVVLIGFLRMIGNTEGLVEYEGAIGMAPSSNLTRLADSIINPLKWVIPGLLLFDGCRTRKRFVLALYTIVAVYLFLAIQIINYMPINSIASMSADELQRVAAKMCSRNIGFSRVTMSMLLSGGSWALFSLGEFFPRIAFRLMCLTGAAIVIYGQALTGGRMGYVAWLAIGLVLCILRWRKLLLLVPAVVIVVTVALPVVEERMFMGISGWGDSNKSMIVTDTRYDTYIITSGRTDAWPLVIEEINKAPLIGYGREAMINIGITMKMAEVFGIREAFAHPHNAYLQFILDNGIVGFAPVILLYLLLMKYAFSLFVEKNNKDSVVIGGVAISLMLALLIAAVGSHSFYPVVGSVGMWSAIGLMLRVHVQRSKERAMNPVSVRSGNFFSVWESA